MEPPLSLFDNAVTGVTPPSDHIGYLSGSDSSRYSASLEATESSTPSPMSSTPLRSGAITENSCESVHDPVTDPGHVLPRIPPPIHELDATWNSLVAKLTAMVDVVQYSRLELDWIVSCPDGFSNRYAYSLHFWTAAAERFNDRFNWETSGKALREQFLKCLEMREGLELEG